MLPGQFAILGSFDSSGTSQAQGRVTALFGNYNEVARALVTVVSSLQYNIDLSTSNVIRQNITIDAKKQPLISFAPPQLEVPLQETINVVGQLGGIETSPGITGFTGGSPADVGSGLDEPVVIQDMPSGGSGGGMGSGGGY